MFLISDDLTSRGTPIVSVGVFWRFQNPGQLPLTWLQVIITHPRFHLIVYSCLRWYIGRRCLPTLFELQIHLRRRCYRVHNNIDGGPSALLFRSMVCDYPSRQVVASHNYATADTMAQRFKQSYPVSTRSTAVFVGYRGMNTARIIPFRHPRPGLSS